MKLCLAGTYAITDTNKDKIKECKYILESFYYVKEWQIPYIKNCDLFLLDSGAFTFMSNQKKGKELGLNDIYEFLDRYIEFINKYDIKYFFNLDLDVIIGVEKTKELRDILEKRTGKKCIPVFHKCMGLDLYKQLTKEYDYIAIGTIQEYRSKDDILKKLVKIAKKNNCKVHGLGFTKNNVIEYGFYSVDSTSWKSGNRFGQLVIFKDKKIKQIPKRKNKRLKSGDYYSKIEYWNFKEWVKYQDYLSKGD